MAVLLSVLLSSATVTKIIIVADDVWRRHVRAKLQFVFVSKVSYDNKKQKTIAKHSVFFTFAILRCAPHVTVPYRGANP